MDPFEHLLGVLPLDNAHLVWIGRRVFVAEPAIGDHPGIRGCHVPDEPVQRLREPVGDVGQTDAALLAILGQFDRADDEDLPKRSPPALLAVEGIAFQAERHFRLIDLDEGLQQASSGVDHGAPELLQQQSGGLVAANAQLPLQLKGRGAVGMRSDNAGRKEPRLERQVAAMHDRAGGL